ncbi:MAG: hypothetical protein L0027_10405 [Candidatus Rokubacteria bacterium]|nr:hypothetical protein [Candidatus Rokubacteria bacterium]
MTQGLLPRFFDQVTRQTFGDLALDDRPAARYLSALLTRFARSEALYATDLLAGRRLDSVVEMLLAIEDTWQSGPLRSLAWPPAAASPAFDVDPRVERNLRRHIGDYTMFMTGVFREHVERMGVIDYYEVEGRRAYRFVGDTAATGAEDDAALFRRLAQRFEQYAGALSYMRKVYLRADRLPLAAGHTPLFRRLSGD